MKHLIQSTAVRLAELSPTCREATRLASAAMDRPLSWRQRLGLRIHLLLCRSCRRFARQIHFLRESLFHRPDLDRDSHQTPLPADARRRIKEQLRHPPQS